MKVSPGGWHVLSGPPNEASTDVAASTGKEVLAVGRDVHGSQWGIGGEAMDITTGHWHLLPFAPEALVGARSAVHGAWTGDELVVVADNPDPLGPRHARQVALAYRPGADHWTVLPELPPLAPKEYVELVGVAGQDIVVAEAEGDVEVLPPGGHQWQEVAAPTVDDGSYSQAGPRVLATGFGPTDRVVAKLGGDTPRWTLIDNAPIIQRSYGGEVWTGQRYLQIQRACGSQASLSEFDPGNDRFIQRRIDPAPLQCGLSFEVAWAGDLVVFLLVAGADYTTVTAPQGAALDPASGHWLSLPPGPPVMSMSQSNVVWDGKQLLVFGDPPSSSPTIPVDAYEPAYPLPHLTSPTVTSPSALPVCTTASLHAVLQETSPLSNETVGGSVALTNTGSTPCRLSGTPELALFASEHQPIPITTTPVDYSAAPGPVNHGPVALDPGRTSSALVYLQFEDSTGPPGGRIGPDCTRSQAPTTVDLTFPGTSGAVPVTGGPTAETALSSLQACNGEFMVGPTNPAASYG